MRKDINVVLDRELKKQIENLKIHPNESCNDVIESGIKILINEREIIELTKNYPNFRIKAGRRDLDHCAMCHEWRCLLMASGFSEKKLSNQNLDFNFWLCKSCLSRMFEQFKNPEKYIEDDH